MQSWGRVILALKTRLLREARQNENIAQVSPDTDKTIRPQGEAEAENGRAVESQQNRILAGKALLNKANINKDVAWSV